MAENTAITSGANRVPRNRFMGCVLICLVLMAFGLYAAFRSLYFGLNQTGMNDYFAFGLWIVVDLSLIAFGAGAFFTGFLVYFTGLKDLKTVLKLAVLIGFICYSSAALLLLIDIGQPLRGWFTFWHPNVHSMLTEVAFCLTLYLIVLGIELLPTITENQALSRVPHFRLFGKNLEEIMFVFAAVGAFLSFFHQGSLGGMFGVLEARPFAFREGFSIWPSTFLLFIISAMAAGPAFLLIVLSLMEKAAARTLADAKTKQLLASIAGKLLAVYIVLKIIDTALWLKGPNDLSEFYSNSPYGLWLIIAEIGLFGLLPAVILNIKPLAKKNSWPLLGALLLLIGVALNRFTMTIVTLALPVLPFESFLAYSPTWQEWGPVIGILAYAVLAFMLAYRYLPLFKEMEI